MAAGGALLVGGAGEPTEATLAVLELPLTTSGLRPAVPASIVAGRSAPAAASTPAADGHSRRSPGSADASTPSHDRYPDIPASLLKTASMWWSATLGSMPPVPAPMTEGLEAYRDARSGASPAHACSWCTLRRFPVGYGCCCPPLPGCGHQGVLAENQLVDRPRTPLESAAAARPATSRRARRSRLVPRPADPAPAPPCGGRGTPS